MVCVLVIYNSNKLCHEWQAYTYIFNYINKVVNIANKQIGNSTEPSWVMGGIVYFQTLIDRPLPALE